jgi:hypothetical protein
MEEYDVSQPGALFLFLTREPDLWNAGGAKLRLEIAKDWAAVGSPMPKEQDMRTLSPAERTKLHHLVKSLHQHSMANHQNDMAGMQREMETLKAQTPSRGKVTHEIEIERDSNGRLKRARKMKHV